MEAYKQSVQQAGDALEDKVNELEHDGNVTAAIFLLKGLRPNKYRERSQVDVKYPKKIDDLPEELLDDFIEQFAAIADAQEKQKELEAQKPAAEQTVDVKAEEPKE